MKINNDMFKSQDNEEWQNKEHASNTDLASKEVHVDL